MTITRTIIPSITATQRAAFAAEDDGLPGIFGPTHRGWSLGNGVALVSGQLYCYRIFPRRDYGITQVWLSVSTPAGANDPLEVAIYNGGFTSKVATSGSVSDQLNVAGDRIVPLSVKLTAGTPYWVAFVATSTASIRFAQMNSSAVVSAFGSAPATLLAMGKSGQTIPLASSSTGFSGSNSVPLLCLRES